MRGLRLLAAFALAGTAAGAWYDGADVDKCRAEYPVGHSKEGQSVEKDRGICHECGGRGILFPVSASEWKWPRALRAILYLTGLLWSFLGVGIIADIFMAAIEVITSKEIEITDTTGAAYKAQVWNATVANLTLMALGSSAPEILLSVIEIMGNNFFSGELGPSTIVGSAAFNLMMILAVCVTALPAGESRKIDAIPVFGVTAVSSVFAYVWLLIILIVSTPNVVDIWEALLTFLFFPLLVGFAYSADKDFFKKGAVKVSPASHALKIGRVEKDDCLEYLKKAKEKNNGKWDNENASTLACGEALKDVPVSRAQHRINANRAMTGGKRIVPPAASLAKATQSDTKGSVPVIEFDAQKLSILESDPEVIAVVTRFPVSGESTVAFATADGTANAGKDYVHQEGTLTFADGEGKKEIRVQIIDDNEPEEDEDFFIRLTPVGDNAVLGEHAEIAVTIIDDDFPGHLGIDEATATATVYETCGVHTFTVGRYNGASGEIQCRYELVGVTAEAGTHFAAASGTLLFRPQEMKKNVAISVVDDTTLEGKNVSLKLVLSDPLGPTKTRPVELVHAKEATLTITTDPTTRAAVDGIAESLNVTLEKMTVGTTSWKQQFVEAFEIEGGEDGQPPAAMDTAMHYITLPFKVAFAIVPPTHYGGGWVCFNVALIFIGAVTAMIGDLASMFGCVIGLKDSVTAITLVALGTSLPDTFASKAAALADDNADASIGNVTGSNSVNVFLGIGMPWLMAAIYWEMKGANTAEWEARYGELNGEKAGSDAGVPKIGHDHKKPVFVVPAGDLGFSVGIFCACAVITLSSLVVRRKWYGCELGGPAVPARNTALLFCFLWFVYVILSSLKAYGMV